MNRLKYRAYDEVSGNLIYFEKLTPPNEWAENLSNIYRNPEVLEGNHG
jgi:hypothetical protein